MPDTNAILANPSAFGFEFVQVNIGTGGQGDKGTSLGTCPSPHLTNEPLFASSFPGFIKAYLNGSSSPRVKAQGICRTARLKNRTITDAALQRLVVEGVLLGGRVSRGVTTVEVRVYILPDDTTTTDRAEFIAAWGLPTEA
jgi:hypothetical protein